MTKTNTEKTQEMKDPTDEEIEKWANDIMMSKEFLQWEIRQTPGMMDLEGPSE